MDTSYYNAKYILFAAKGLEVMCGNEPIFMQSFLMFCKSQPLSYFYQNSNVYRYIFVFLKSLTYLCRMYFYPYQLNEFISNFMVIGCYFSLYSN